MICLCDGFTNVVYFSCFKQRFNLQHQFQNSTDMIHAKVKIYGHEMKIFQNADIFWDLASFKAGLPNNPTTHATPATFPSIESNQIKKPSFFEQLIKAKLQWLILKMFTIYRRSNCAVSTHTISTKTYLL